MGSASPSIPGGFLARAMHALPALELSAPPSASKWSEHRQDPSPRWVTASSDWDAASGSSVSLCF